MTQVSRNAPDERGKQRGGVRGGGATELLGFSEGRKKRGIAQNLKISVSGLPGWALQGRDRRGYGQDGCGVIGGLRLDESG